jgi:SAM-dependent methyltransferase
MFGIGRSPPPAAAPPHREPTRADVLNALAAVHRRPAYLEVGVYTGDTFLQVRAASRTAVDPHLRFDTAAVARGRPADRFHEMESDAFFGSPAAGRGRFDVIFLDGLHTFEQTLRDFMNAVSVLAPGGVIVIDDVLPSAPHAALPDWADSVRAREAAGSADDSWMGDVYRLVYFIGAFCPSWTLRTVAEAPNLAVVWAQPRRPDVRRGGYGAPVNGVEAIARLSYEEMLDDPAPYHRTPLEQVVAEYRAARGRA